MTFKYEAVSLTGVNVKGIIRAKDENDAVAQLKASCSVVNKLTEVKESKNDIMAKLNAQPIKTKDLAMMCKQFSIILHAGLPIVRSVEMVMNQTSNKSLKRILLDVAEDVVAGYDVASAFSMRGPQLPNILVETIRAGEESGQLDASFERLSKYFEKSGKIKSKVVSALTYPIFVIIVAVVVIAIIMVRAVPTFVSSFLDMGSELPGVTMALIGLSDFFVKAWPYLLGAVIVIVAGLYIYGATPKGKLNMAHIKLKIPVIGKIQLMNASSQFANTFSTLLASGLPMTRAMGITGRALSNAYIGSKVLDAIEGVEQGFRVADSLKVEKCFPELLNEMVNVGEQSASMEQTLSVVGEYYDNEVEVTTARATALLEPVIICILAVFVCWVLLAVYLPMFSMYSTYDMLL